MHIEVRFKDEVIISASLQALLLRHLFLSSLPLEEKVYEQLHYFVDGKDQGKLYTVIRDL